MLATLVKVLRATQDTNAALPGGTYILGCSIKNGTLTATASIKLHDAATVTGNPVLEVGANLADSTTFDEYNSLILPYPVKFETGVSIDMTGTNSIGYVYYI